VPHSVVTGPELTRKKHPCLFLCTGVRRCGCQVIKNSGQPDTYMNKSKLTTPVASNVNGLAPEFVDVTGATQLFPFSRSFVHKRIPDGSFASYLLRDKNRVKGMRVIPVQSIRDFIERHKHTKSHKFHKQYTSKAGKLSVIAKREKKAEREAAAREDK
jgi:hypothetical protein